MIATFLLLSCAIIAPPVSADLVAHNGKIWTVDKRHPEVQALASAS